jgi:prophage antirepressor-like protein
MAGYKTPRDVINRLDEDYKIKLSYEEAKELLVVSDFSDTEINSKGLTLVTEPGLYKLAFGKNKEFEKWVTKEVLPAIRKTGNYQVETQNNRLIQNLMANTEALLGIRREEIAILQQESPNKKLSNLMIDCSSRGLGTMNELYNELLDVFDTEIGIDIREIACDMGLSWRDYLVHKPELCETLYKLAFSRTHTNKNKLKTHVTFFLYKD